MASDHASSVQGVALQVCKLGPDGKPLVGAKTSFVTDAFMRFGWSTEYTTGEEIEQKAANGNVCISYQPDDVMKRVTFSLAICDPSPELTEILVGGNILLPASGTDPIGYAAPAAGVAGTPNGVGFEVFSRAIVDGKPDAELPYFRWVFPYAKMKFAGDRVLENGAMAWEFEGWGIGNIQYGKGPAGNWPFQTDRAYQFARTATVPLGINDYVPVTVGAAPVAEVQTVTVASATGGTFTLSFSGNETGDIAYNAPVAAVQTALRAVVGQNNVNVTGTVGSYTVTFVGAYSGVNVPQLVADGTDLTGGTVSVVTTTPGA
jgi:hypothetical protein